MQKHSIAEMSPGKASVVFFAVLVLLSSLAPCFALEGKDGVQLKGRYWHIIKPAGEVEEDVFLDPQRTAFMLIDVYGLFPDDPAYKDLPEFYKSSPEAEKARKALFRKMLAAKKAAKSLKMPVVYLQNYLAPSLNENTEWRNLSLRTAGVDVLKVWREPAPVLAFSKMMAPEAGEYVIKKQMYSGFFETDLHSLLQSLDVRTIVAVGFDANICLRTTLTDAMYRGYRIVLLRDCTRTSETPETENGELANMLAIRFIEKCVGYTAISEDFIKGCEAAKK